jgi:hypothetical protein
MRRATKPRLALDRIARAIVSAAPFAGVAAGAGEIEKALRRAGKNPG